MATSASQAILEAQQGAVRNLPISDDLRNILEYAARTAGVDQIRVFSGGQPQAGKRRTGSHRHDLGGAADINLVVNGRELDFNSPQDRDVFAAFAEAAAQAGATGIGAGKGYMGSNAMHVGFGNKAVWGRGGHTANAPEWLVSAVNRGWGDSTAAAPKTAQSQSLTSSTVKGIQRALNAGGFKGETGKSLRVDGILGPNTQSAIDTALTSGVAPTSSRNQVRALQAALRASGVTDKTGRPVAIDGIYGPRTTQAVKAYATSQRGKDFIPDLIRGAGNLLAGPQREPGAPPQPRPARPEDQPFIPRPRPQEPGPVAGTAFPGRDIGGRAAAGPLSLSPQSLSGTARGGLSQGGFAQGAPITVFPAIAGTQAVAGGDLGVGVSAGPLNMQPSYGVAGERQQPLRLSPDINRPLGQTPILGNTTFAPPPRSYTPPQEMAGTTIAGRPDMPIGQLPAQPAQQAMTAPLGQFLQQQFRQFGLPPEAFNANPSAAAQQALRASTTIAGRPDVPVGTLPGQPPSAFAQGGPGTFPPGALPATGGAQPGWMERMLGPGQVTGTLQAPQPAPPAPAPSSSDGGIFGAIDALRNRLGNWGIIANEPLPYSQTRSAAGTPGQQAIAKATGQPPLLGAFKPNSYVGGRPTTPTLPDGARIGWQRAAQGQDLMAGPAQLPVPPEYDRPPVSSLPVPREMPNAPSMMAAPKPPGRNGAFALPEFTPPNFAAPPTMPWEQLGGMARRAQENLAYPETGTMGVLGGQPAQSAPLMPMPVGTRSMTSADASNFSIPGGIPIPSTGFSGGGAAGANAAAGMDQYRPNTMSMAADLERRGLVAPIGGAPLPTIDGNPQGTGAPPTGTAQQPQVRPDMPMSQGVPLNDPNAVAAAAQQAVRQGLGGMMRMGSVDLASSFPARQWEIFNKMPAAASYEPNVAMMSRAMASRPEQMQQQMAAQQAAMAQQERIRQAQQMAANAIVGFTPSGVGYPGSDAFGNAYGTSSYGTGVRGY